MTQPGDWDPFDADEASRAEARRRAYERGIAHARRVLADHGALPPRDAAHAGLHDPPLSVVETRHWVHGRSEAPVEGCRFCDQAEELHPRVSCGTSGESQSRARSSSDR